MVTVLEAEIPVGGAMRKVEITRSEFLSDKSRGFETTGDIVNKYSLYLRDRRMSDEPKYVYYGPDDPTYPRSQVPIAEVQVQLVYRNHGTEQADAFIIDSWVEPSYRGARVGTWFYKAVINDLTDEGFTVHSDTARKPGAERIWQALMKGNPGVVEYSKIKTDRYSAYGPVRRRVSVRRHARRG